MVQRTNYFAPAITLQLIVVSNHNSGVKFCLVLVDMAQQRDGVPDVDFDKSFSGLISKLLDHTYLTERVANMLDFKSLIYLQNLSFKISKEKKGSVPWLLDRKHVVVVKLLR